MKSPESPQPKWIFFLTCISILSLLTYNRTSSFSTALHSLGCEFRERNHSEGLRSRISQKRACCTSVLIRFQFLARMRENHMKLGTINNNDVKDNVTGLSLGLDGLPVWRIWLSQFQQETLSQNIKWREIEKVMLYLPLASLWVYVCAHSHTQRILQLLFTFSVGETVFDLLMVASSSPANSAILFFFSILRGTGL